MTEPNVLPSEDQPEPKVLPCEDQPEPDVLPCLWKPDTQRAEVLPCENFSSTIISFYDPETFSPEKEFEVYEGRYEIYNPEKVYEKKEFTREDGRIYENVLWSFGHPDSGKKLGYVVVKEIISEEELQTLKPHCQCIKHQMYWYHWQKSTICPCCVGCLDAGCQYADPWVIKKTREFVEAKKHTNPYPYPYPYPSIFSFFW